MLKVVSLNGETHNTFPEPEGEIITVVEHNKRNHILTLLVRTDESGDGVADEQPEPVNSEPVEPEELPFAPGELSVSDLRSTLAESSDYEWDEARLLGLLQAERNGEDRSTAVAAIEEALEN